MKKILIISLMLSLNIPSIAQSDSSKIVYVNEQVSTHFVCSEPVQYVDISTDKVVGDLPMKNVLRIKPKDNELGNLGVLTIIAQQYMVQYEIVYTRPTDASRKIVVGQKDAQSLLLHEVEYSYEDMRANCARILQTKSRRPRQRIRELGIEARLNQIYTVGEYYLVDLSILNRTKIQYDIDQIRFKIADKKITKATNFQEVEIEPEYQFYRVDSFEKKYRNVFVFKKFTYPNQKVFSIELSEKQISGRNIKLEIDYKKVLNADVL
jgi:conjugative transposon TraN protein